jgi:hypothetical protein
LLADLELGDAEALLVGAELAVVAERGEVLGRVVAEGEDVVPALLVRAQLRRVVAVRVRVAVVVERVRALEQLRVRRRAVLPDLLAARPRRRRRGEERREEDGREREERRQKREWVHAERAWVAVVVEVGTTARLAICACWSVRATMETRCGRRWRAKRVRWLRPPSPRRGTARMGIT